MENHQILMAKSPCFIGHQYQSYVSHNQRLPEGIPPPFLKHPEPQPHFAWPVSDAPLNGLISRTDYRKICGFRRFFIFFPHISFLFFHSSINVPSIKCISSTSSPIIFPNTIFHKQKSQHISQFVFNVPEMCSQKL